MFIVMFAGVAYGHMVDSEITHQVEPVWMCRTRFSVVVFVWELMVDSHVWTKRLGIDYSNGDSGSNQDSIRNIYADLNPECL